MRNSSQKSQGRKSLGQEQKKRQHVRHFLVSQIASGAKRWSDLWKNDERGKKIFGSKSYLSQELDALEKEGIIKSERFSHKYKTYSLTEGSELVNNLIKIDEDRDDQLDEILFNIAEAKDGHPVKRKYILKFITASIGFEFLQLLSAIQLHAKAKTQVKQLTGALLDSSANRLAVLIDESNRKFPNSTEKSLTTIKQLSLEVVKEFNNKNFPDLQAYISKEEILLYDNHGRN